MAVAQSPGFLGTVGDMEDGHSGFPVNGLEEVAHFLMKFLVERIEGFIEQKNLGAEGECPPEGDALGFPATQTLGKSIEKFRKPQQLRQIIHPGVELAFRRLANHQGEGELISNPLGGKERTVQGTVSDSAFCRLE